MRTILGAGYAFGWVTTIGWVLAQPGPPRTIRQVVAAGVLATIWPAAVIIGAVAHTIQSRGDR